MRIISGKWKWKFVLSFVLVLFRVGRLEWKNFLDKRDKRERKGDDIGEGGDS